MTHNACKIVSNQEIAPDIFEIVLDTRDFPMSAPGQFVMIYLDRGELLLPRPISICRQEKNITLLVYKVAGNGTEYMSTLKSGDALRITGPLGNGFTIKEGLKKIALIGGGIGIPPMVSIFDKLKGKDIEIDVFLGFKKEHFLTNLFSGAHLRVISEDIDAFAKQPYPSGDVFAKSGNPITLLAHYGADYDEIYACGPKPMLAALSRYAEDKNVPLQVSLEERMACGIGVCMGCVTPPSYMKICCVGPVFYSDKVDI